jgi:hypothetical protein
MNPDIVRCLLAFICVQETVMSKLACASTSLVNPNGIPSSSPGLRGTSYPGFATRPDTTLKGLNPCATDAAATPVGLKMILDGYPG